MPLFWKIALITAICSYLIGSIPTGYIIVKLKTGQDIRKTGSGSTGATNVKRILGKKWFFIVMILDAIKGILPVALAECIISARELGIFVSIAALFTIIGHSKPIFLGFRGGKSVATGIGTFIALNPLLGLITAIIWGALTYLTKYVSVGSIIAVISGALLFGFYEPRTIVFLYTFVAAVYITVLHSANIKRLIKGEENKVRE